MEEVWREKNRMTDLAGMSVLNGTASDRRGCTSCGKRKSVIVQRIDAGSSGAASGHKNTEGRFNAQAVHFSHHRIGGNIGGIAAGYVCPGRGSRSEEHTSELQSLMRISYAVFCLKKKIQYNT